jgi:hypothetical protein
MALRDKLRDRVQPLLEPDEQIRSVFLAETGPNPMFRALTVWLMFLTKYFIIARTDRRIVVISASRFKPAQPTAIAETFPAETVLTYTPASIWQVLMLNGTRYWVHRRFREDMDAASTP